MKYEIGTTRAELTSITDVAHTHLQPRIRHASRRLMSMSAATRRAMLATAAVMSSLRVRLLRPREPTARARSPGSYSQVPSISAQLPWEHSCGLSMGLRAAPQFVPTRSVSSSSSEPNMESCGGPAIFSLCLASHPARYLTYCALAPQHSGQFPR
jgi:hypothetical protein